MKVPLLDLSAHHSPIREELDAAITSVVDSGYFILGPEVSALEASLAEYTGSRFAIGVSSGTDALLLALMGLKIGSGDEVITSTFSFFATAGVIARCGATPVFVDIDPVTFNLDPAAVEAAVTGRTRVIIPVHLYGQCADMDAIGAIADKHDLYVVEDAAQALGCRYKDDRVSGSIGDIGCFSFFPTKNLGAMGDAGMVVTSDDSLADYMRILRVHGSEPKYYHKYVGGNFRIDALQAAILNVKLKYLDQWHAARRENAALYEQLFAEKGLDGDKLQTPAAVYREAGVKNDHIYNQFICRVTGDRDALRTFLQEKEIANEVYYPIPFHLQECFADLAYQKGDFPEAEKAADETIALPVYPELSEEQIAWVVEQIAAFYA